MNPLSALAAAGVVERAGRHRQVLRVAPRFMAHVEAAGQGAWAVETALATWDEYRSDVRQGGAIVRDLLARQGLSPVLESYAA